MAQIILVGLGAGAASALLFASIASGSILSVVLFYLAPLPIMIAAVGWSHWAGLVAGGIAAASVGLGLGPYFFVAFLTGIALPAWWLGYLALLARPVTADGATTVEWYPVGRIVLWAAMIGAFLVIVGIPALGSDKETVQSTLRIIFERAIQFQTPADAPPRADTDRLISMLVAAMPPAAAVLSTLINMVNLWLAGRIARISGRLARPWPDLAMLTLPGITPGILALAIAGWFLPDLPGLLSGVLALSLLMAYALIGFSVLHAITRGMGSRPFLLATAYAAVVIFSWPILLVALIGLLDTGLDIRAMVAARRGPPTIKT